MLYPHLPYAFTEAYCAAFAVTVWLRLNYSIGSEHEIRQLRNMIYSYVVMLASDIIWALNEDNLIRMPRLLNASVNAVMIMAIVAGCYFWFRFIEDRLHFRIAAHKTLNALIAVPFLVVCTLDLTSIFTGWIFYIDAAGHYQSTGIFYIHTITNYLYLLIPTVCAIRKAIRTHSRQDRAEYWTYTLYMVAPLIAGLLEEAVPDVPLLALNIFLVILILFLMIQNLQVYNDALTGLNNRRRLNRYLEEYLPKASQEHPILLFILDINSFKAINDAFGHIEGDKALKTLSLVLKDVAAEYDAFVARYGGDEFCMVMNASELKPDEIIERINRHLQDSQLKKLGNGESQYVITVSTGYTICDGKTNVPETVLAQADQELYRNKQEWHKNHGS